MPRTAWDFEPPHGFYTVRQAAEALNMNEYILDSEIDAGKVRVQFHRGTMIISAVEIKKYRDSQRYIHAVKKLLEKIKTAE